MPNPSYKLSEIAARLGLQLELKSPEDDIVITGINTLEEAGPSELSFLANPKYASQLASTKAGAVIVKPDHKDEVARALVTDNPYPMFAQALTLFARPQGSFSGALSVSCLQKIKFSLFDCKFYVLHISVMFFKNIRYFCKTFVN